MTALVDLASVKALLGVTGNSGDAVLTQIINAASDALGNYCNRDFDEADFTEYRDGNDAVTMTLVHYPLVTVSSVTVDGQSLAFTFPPKGRKVILANGCRFTAGNRNVVIQGRAGYGGSILWPSELQFAAQQWVCARYNERQRLGIGSKSLAGESISFVQADPAVGNVSTGIPAAAKTALRNYVNTVPENGL